MHSKIKVFLFSSLTLIYLIKILQFFLKQLPVAMLHKCRGLIAPMSGQVCFDYIQYLTQADIKEDTTDTIFDVM